MNDIVSKFKKLQLISVVMLALNLAVAIVLYRYPDYSVKVNSLILGGLLMVHGFFSFIKYFYNKINSKIFSYNLVSGVVALILGLFLCLYEVKTISVVGILVGIWFVSEAMIEMIRCIKLFKNHEEIAPLVTFSSLIILVMGALIIFNPFHKYINIPKLISIFMFAYSVLYGMICLLYRKRAKELLSIFR